MDPFKFTLQLGLLAGLVLLMSGSNGGCDNNGGPCVTCTAYDFINYEEVEEEVCSVKDKDNFYKDHPSNRYEITFCQ